MSSTPEPSSVMAAFDLPAMPPSFEDFHFSLDLPENITASDFNLVSSPGFSNLFGMPTSLGSSGPFTPSALIASENSTPKGASGMEHTSDDTVMAGSSRRPSISSTLGLALDPHVTSAPTGSAMTSMPGPPANAAPAPTSSSQSLTLEEYLARNSIPGLIPQAPQFPVNSAAPKGLFDANETTFLTNFLQGFEGWDFNPNLPLDLPSFADAERSAYTFGMPSAPTSGLPDSRRRRSANGIKSKSSPGSALNNPHLNSPSHGRIESSVGAAFGRPMADWNEEDEEEDEGNKDQKGRRKSAHKASDDATTGKKIKREHSGAQQKGVAAEAGASAAAAAAADAASKRELLSDHEKRQNHILSEQRRRNHIREAFKELVDLLEAGREFGARGLGLSSGAGTGIEDEGLDDRSDYESTLEDEEPAAAAKRRKAKQKRKAAMEAILSSGGRLSNGSAATRGRGKGRGRGGSAGGGAGSKSAVLFQAVDLLRWLEGRNHIVEHQIHELEEAIPVIKAA